MVIRLSRRIASGQPVAILSLPFELRQRSRLAARLSDGTDVGVFLPRGSVLRDGDLLASDGGLIVRVEAAPERVSSAHTQDPLRLARACYHLGNRHVPLQIGAGWLRYEQDHVLDEMVLQLGLAVVSEHAPFEPEAGAYGAHTHSDGSRVIDDRGVAGGSKETSFKTRLEYIPVGSTTASMPPAVMKEVSPEPPPPPNACSASR